MPRPTLCEARDKCPFNKGKDGVGQNCVYTMLYEVFSVCHHRSNFFKKEGRANATDETTQGATI